MSHFPSYPPGDIPPTWTADRCAQVPLVPMISKEDGQLGLIPVGCEVMITEHKVRAVGAMDCKYHLVQYTIDMDGCERPVMCSGRHQAVAWGYCYLDVDTGVEVAATTYEPPDSFVALFDSMKGGVPT